MSESKFPERVTQGEDGVYRWAYSMDMYHNHYLRNVLLKVFGVICLVCYALMLFLFISDGQLTGRIFMVLTLCFLGAMALVLLGYYAAAALMHGTYRLQFQMNEELVMLVRKGSTQDFMDTVAMFTPAGNAQAASGITRFREVRGMKERREYDAFNLRTVYGGNQIWVPQEDYEFVWDYVDARIPERARRS